MDVVYLIAAAAADGPVHIGHCSLATLERRLDAMQAAHWQPLALLGVYDGDERLARRLGVHARRHRLRANWYAAAAREGLTTTAGALATAVNVNWKASR